MAVATVSSDISSAYLEKGRFEVITIDPVS